MKGHLLGIILGVGILVGGCAWLKQAFTDTKVGISQPTATGETPKEVAERQLQGVKDLPYGNVAYPIGVGLMTIIYGWLNGRRIRKGLGVKPITSNPFINETIQTTASIVKGVISPPVTLGSFWTRFWKVAAGIVLVIGSAMLSSPTVGNFIMEHPELSTILGIVLPTIIGLEKKVQEILPN